MRADGIVVAGEALVDLVLARDGSVAAHPGGGPYNVARTAGRLEAAVAYLGRLSTDAFGRRLRAELEADGVDLACAVATDAPTTLALAELDTAGAATYRFYVDGTSAPGLGARDAAGALPADGGTLCVGTLGLVFEPMATTLEALVGRAGDGVLVALDPNCRPAAIPDPDRFRARLDRLFARADVVKVSEEDVAWLRPGTPPVSAARDLLADDRAVALVTLGGDGAVVVTRAAERPVSAPPVQAVDTIGAGDAFMGAFLAEWRRRELRRAELADLDAVVAATAFACRVAAVTCTRPGADPPRRSELAAAGGP